MKILDPKTMKILDPRTMIALTILKTLMGALLAMGARVVERGLRLRRWSLEVSATL